MHGSSKCKANRNVTLDAVLSVLITTTILLAVSVLFPTSDKYHSALGTAYLLCRIFIGCWFGRWHVPKQTVKSSKSIPDHRATMRSLDIKLTDVDEPDSTFQDHLILSLSRRGEDVALLINGAQQSGGNDRLLSNGS